MGAYSFVVMPQSPRERQVALVRARLCRTSLPRLQMLFLVTLTGLAGLGGSALMLHSGVTSMGWRYLGAFGVAYLCFLSLLWLWLRTTADDFIDLADPTWSPGGGSSSGHFLGGGGSSGGGGASGNWDVTGATDADFGGVGDAAGSVSGIADADELALPLIVVALLAVVMFAGVTAAGVLVWTAPSLFAEISVDSALALSLYRRLHRRDDNPAHWLQGAIRRTLWPFAVTAVVFALGGALLQYAAPGATTLRETLAILRA